MKPRKNPDSLRVPYHASIDGSLLRDLKTLAPTDKPFTDHVNDLLRAGAAQLHGEYYDKLADFIRQQQIAS